MYWKIILIAVFLFIFFQDFKDRLVYWFLYPIVGVLGIAVQLDDKPLLSVVVDSGVNLVMVLVLLFANLLYVKLIMRRKNFSEAFGLGDILLLLAAAFNFDTVCFPVFLTLSLVFALACSAIFKKNFRKFQNVPLAGYMSLFFALLNLYALTLSGNP